jgi:hypothetical protein
MVPAVIDVRSSTLGMAWRTIGFAACGVLPMIM